MAPTRLLTNPSELANLLDLFPQGIPKILQSPEYETRTEAAIPLVHALQIRKRTKAGAHLERYVFSQAQIANVGTQKFRVYAVREYQKFTE